MRTAHFLIAGLLLSATAHAQFANRSLGLGLNTYKMFNGNEGLTVPLTLEGSLYIDNGFDAYVHVPLMVLNSKADAVNPFWVFAAGLHVGVRYLILQEQFRPYVGLQLSGLVLVKQPDVEIVAGPGAIAGVDWFVADLWSIGLRASYDLLIELNVPLRHNLGFGLNVATHF